VAFPFVIDSERRFVQATFSEIVTGRDLVLTAEAIYDDPDWRPGFDIIWNCAQITNLIFDAGDADEFASLQRAHAHAGAGGRDIIIVKRILDDAMARLYAAMRENDRRRTRLCASEATALEILAQGGDAQSV
jgi:hypothetical protein